MGIAKFHDIRALQDKPRNHGRRVLKLTLLLFAVLTLIGFGWIDLGGQSPRAALLKALEDLGILFFAPALSASLIVPSLKALLMTLSLAFITTLTGGFLALLFGLLGAQNLTSRTCAILIRSVVAFVRAIPTEFWVLIFAISAGLGGVAAIAGMTFHSFGYLIKAFSESFEEIDHGVIEALRASGANWLQIVFQAVIPSTASILLSWLFVRFEINFAVAVAMGAAAGAGGIGFDLYMAGNYAFSLPKIGYFTWLILIVAWSLEMIAVWLRNRLNRT